MSDALQVFIATLVPALLAAVWKYVKSESPAVARIEQRVREVVKVGFALASKAIAAGHIKSDELRAETKRVARLQLMKLSIPVDGAIVALVDHEVDVLAAELEEQSLVVALDQLRAATDARPGTALRATLDAGDALAASHARDIARAREAGDLPPGDVFASPGPVTRPEP